MDTDNKPKSIRVENGGIMGSIWFIGWLFTLAYANLAWWQAIIGIFLWPYYLGAAVR